MAASDDSREFAQEDIAGAIRDDSVTELGSEILDAESRAVEVGGRSRYFDLRDTWSRWIIGWITFLIVFNAGVTVAVGFEWLDYTRYGWFITAVLLQTLVQIVALGAVAVAYLFRSG